MSDPAPTRKRRDVLRLGALAGLSGLLRMPGAAAAPDADPDLSHTALLADPATPTGGNPQGDVTLVTFFDYNCPVCMATQPAFAALVASDPGLRVVYKDWPIFGGGSVGAARVALAAAWQGRYVAVHDALLGTPLRKVAFDQITTIAAKAGADRTRLVSDGETHRAAIDAVLARTLKQAERLRLPGTPAFLIGPLLVTHGLDLAGFRAAVAAARRRPAG